MGEKAGAVASCIGACCCFGAAFGVTLALSINYATLLGQAEDYNAVQTTAIDYDDCGGVFGDNSLSTTQWTQIYKFNYIIYLILACLSGSAMLCVPCAPAIMCPMICFMCSGLPAFVAIILTGIRMLNDKGDLCAANTTPYDAVNNLTFAGDAEHMRALWIT